MKLIIRRTFKSMTISEFYQLYKEGKVDLAPFYQRHDAWSTEQKSFLIDSILKNIPIQQIVLHQKLKENNGVVYDVIDGRQRLNSLIEFIEGNIEIPIFYDEDILGDKRLNGLNINQIKMSNDLKQELKDFWNYEISVEYITSDNYESINIIFDRLNKTGEKLNFQELRNAKYSQSNLYKLIKELIEIDFWRERLRSLKINRMADEEFLSELLFVLLENDVLESTPVIIDKLYHKWKDIDRDEFNGVLDRFKRITETMVKFDLDYEDLKINGVSHLYGLWCFAKYCSERNTNNYDILKDKLTEMFINLRTKNFSNEWIAKYRRSMDSATKTVSQRKLRLECIVKYCEETDSKLYEYYSNQIFEDLDSGDFYKQNNSIVNFKLYLDKLTSIIKPELQERLGKKIVEIAPSNYNSGSYEARDLLQNLNTYSSMTFDFVKGMFLASIIRIQGNTTYLWLVNEYLDNIINALFQYDKERVLMVIDDLINIISNKKIESFTNEINRETSIQIIENFKEKCTDNKDVVDKLERLVECLNKIKLT